MHAAQIRENINNRIIEALEKGVKPWVRPWRNDPNCGHPTSFATRKLYNGINPVLLDLTAQCSGYLGKYWGTFEQWRCQGAWVKKGEKATWVVLFKPVKRENEKTGKEETIPIMRQFPVFSIDQVNGDSVDIYRPNTENSDSPILFENADKIINATGAEIKFGGNRACFSPSSKIINVPVRKHFETQESFYSTVFHELSHWADDKLGQDLRNRFGSEDYAFGELVAEISACYLSSAAQIPIGKRFDLSIEYLGSWINRMKDDPNYILKASTRASAASNYILGFSQPAEKMEEETATV